MPTDLQRMNLLKLANYLESLPEDYKHFDMSNYADHRGNCDLPMNVDVMAATTPQEFFANCGTVACAVGHGPAAGIAMSPATREWPTHEWNNYASRAFGTNFKGRGLYYFLFSCRWEKYDNHHYGAAARIRYYLATDETLPESAESQSLYAPYRKQIEVSNASK